MIVPFAKNLNIWWILIEIYMANFSTTHYNKHTFHSFIYMPTVYILCSKNRKGSSSTVAGWMAKVVLCRREVFDDSLGKPSSSAFYPLNGWRKEAKLREANCKLLSCSVEIKIKAKKWTKISTTEFARTPAEKSWEAFGGKVFWMKILKAV